VRAQRGVPFGAATLPPELPTTAMGWEVAPDALYDLLVRLRTEYPPVPLLITENGAAYADPIPDNGLVEDPERLAYLRAHIEALARAVAAGVDVDGYYAWSLFDNFEWEHGYGKRFGLVYVDYETQRRIPKQSGLWYRDWIAAQGSID
jgi:beta-glucosidase